MADPTSTPGGEPRQTIYVPIWRKARANLALLSDLEGGARLGRLLEAVEAAWEHLRPLALLSEQHRATAPGTLLDDLCAFLHLEVLDHFRSVALDAARLVPGAPGWEPSPALEDIPSEAGMLLRNLSVLELAAASPAFPDLLREPVRSAAAGLRGWHPAFHAALDPVADAIRRSEDDANDEDGLESDGLREER